jgi:hypothetical protein
MFNMFIEQRGAAQIDNGVFDRGITEKSPDSSSGACFFPGFMSTDSDASWWLRQLQTLQSLVVGKRGRRSG